MCLQVRYYYRARKCREEKKNYELLLICSM